MTNITASVDAYPTFRLVNASVVILYAVSYTHLDVYKRQLLMLKQYNLFLESFQFACKNYKGNTNEADIAKVRCV